MHGVVVRPSRVDTGASPKGELPSPAWGQHGGRGCRTSGPAVSGLPREGGKHLAVSVSDRKLPAPISPAPAALSAPKLWVEPPPGEPPSWGQSLQLQTGKPWLRDRGQAQPLSWPPRPWRTWGCKAPEGRKQRSDMGSDLHFLSPAFRMCGPNLGLENAMVAEG